MRRQVGARKPSRWGDRIALVAVALAAAACADDAAGTSTSTGSGSTLTGAGGSGDGGGDDSSGSGPSGSGPSGSGPSGSGPGSTGSGSGSTTTGAGGGATSSSASGTGGGGTGGGPTETLRFIAMGDGGEGNDTQYAVAAMIANVCAAEGGCHFALYLGDNFYDDGVDSSTDRQFQTKFEMPYADLDFQFWVVLGNHDYGGNGAGYEQEKAEHQVEYSSSKWTMPERYYAFHVPGDAGPPGAPTVDFFGLDTNWIMYSGDGDQQSWLEGELAASTATWKIAFGHHPYISNGQHGNAGEYEGIPFIPIVSGQNVKDFFDDSICDSVTLYISGHDHNRQWLEPDCGVEFVVTGTAAKTTDLVGRGTPTLFEDDVDGGFLLVEIEGDTLTGTFYDQQGNVEFTRTISP
jgi:hypothetical protein